MSRSIHRTRRDLAEALEHEYADAQHRAAHLDRMREELARKRRIKAQVRIERRHGRSLLPPLSPEAIPIRVRERSALVHYPASAEDIRAVMRRLPPGVLDGLSAIDLCLGLEYQRAALSPWLDDEADPFTGRIGVELWPGVFSGRVLGVYSPGTARIRLFAYVYDGAMPDRPLKELYLRLQMLSTFVHEVAHHLDFTARIARGRWLADRSEKREIYAENVQHEWVQRSVVPYLESVYGEEWQALDAWIAHHGGTSIPLALLAGDPRTTVKGNANAIRVVFSIEVWGAFETLVAEVSQGKDLAATRVQFALDLHSGEHYAEALAIFERVLEEEPEHLEALTLQADIGVHQEQYDLAEALCERVLSRDENYAPAWRVLADIHWERRDWGKLLHAATRALSLLESGSWEWLRSLEERARARLEVGDTAGLQEDLEALEQSGDRMGQLEGMALRAVMLLRAGRDEEALQVAMAALQEATAPPRWHRSRELVAVRFEAAHRLGRPSDAGELTVRDIEVLRHKGYEEWMDRLIAEYGLEPPA